MKKFIAFRQKLFVKLLSIALLGILLSACVEDVSLENLESIQISASDPTIGNILTENKVHAFIAEGVYLDGSTANITKQVVWSSSNTLFNVSNESDNSGQVTPITLGSDQLIATAGEISNSFDVIITSANPSSSGTVIVSEIMKNPVELDDANGEWFELYNTSTETFSLVGCQITDNSSIGTDSYFINEDITIEPGTYLIFASSADAVANPDVIYNNFTLSNTMSDEIILKCVETQIDWVQFDDGTTFPSTAGVSLNLNPLTLDGTSNNDGVNWCDSTSLYSSDYGTPGSANDTCEISETTPIEISITPIEVSLFDGEEVQFTSEVTGAEDDSVNWSLRENIDGILSTSGLFNAPATNRTYQVRAESNADVSKTKTATVNVSVVTLEITPPSITVVTGTEQLFTAAVTGTENGNVLWEASGGSITENGLFTAPALIGSYIITATSQADPRKSNTATVTVTDPIKLTLSASSINLFEDETFQLTAMLENASNNGILWSLEGEGSGTVSNTGSYTAPLTAGIYRLTASSIEDPSVTADVEITVNIIEVTFPATSTSVTTTPNDSVSLSADILNYKNSNVIWWASNGGTINQYGLFSAPVAGNYTVIATSVDDDRKSATTTIIVAEPVIGVSVSITPQGITVYEGQNVEFTSNVANATDQSVSWQIITPGTSEEVGTLSSDGTYSAPFSPGVYQVEIISNEDTSKSAIAIINVVGTLTVTQPNIVLTPGNSFQFSAFTSGIQTSNVTWSTTSGTISQSGLYVAAQGFGPYTVTATSTIDNSQSVSVDGVVIDPSLISVNITPQEVTMTWLGSAVFTAEVSGTNDNEVTWGLMGLHGAITQDGRYFSSALVGGSYLVRATSKQDPSIFSYATVRILIAAVEVSPNGVSLNSNEQYQFNATVTGHDNTDVIWSTTNGLIDANGLYTAPADPGTYQVTATSVTDFTRKGSVTVIVNSESEIRVEINNDYSKRLYDGDATQLSATVSGTENTALSWSIIGEDSGTITDTGLYTAPLRAGIFQVIATSVADPTKFASATIEVGKIEVTLTAASSRVVTGGKLELFPIVTGYFENGWVFYIDTVGGSNQYIAPSTPGMYTVTAYSMEDETKSGSVMIEVINPAYYELTDDANGDTFVIYLTDADKIYQANSIIENDLPLSVMGSVIREPATYNPPWSYYLAPNSIEFFEIAVGTCNFTAQYVEDNLAEVGGELLPGFAWCPTSLSLTRTVSR